MKRTSTWIIIILVIAAAVFAYMKMNKSADNEEANEAIVAVDSGDVVADDTNNENDQDTTGGLVSWSIVDTGDEAMAENIETILYIDEDFWFSFDYPINATLDLESSVQENPTDYRKDIFISMGPRSPMGNNILQLTIYKMPEGSTETTENLGNTIAEQGFDDGTTVTTKRITLGGQKAALLIPTTTTNAEALIQWPDGNIPLGEWAQVAFIYHGNQYSITNLQSKYFELFLKLLQSFSRSS